MPAARIPDAWNVVEGGHNPEREAEQLAQIFRLVKELGRAINSGRLTYVGANAPFKWELRAVDVPPPPRKRPAIMIVERENQPYRELEITPSSKSNRLDDSDMRLGGLRLISRSPGAGKRDPDNYLYLEVGNEQNPQYRRVGGNIRSEFNQSWQLFASIVREGHYAQYSGLLEALLEEVIGILGYFKAETAPSKTDLPDDTK